MHRRDLRLQCVGAGRTRRRGALQGLEAAADENVVPAPAILVEQQHRLAARADARSQARGLDLHQRDQAVHLGLLRREPCEDAPETQRVLAQRGPHPVVAGGGGIAFVEDQVGHFEHGGDA